MRALIYIDLWNLYPGGSEVAGGWTGHELPAFKHRLLHL